MKDLINKKVLITTEKWFYGKDGKQYKAIHGTLKAIHEASKTLGFTPNRAHANWVFEVGNMFITGCQVQYIEQCDEVHLGLVKEWSTETGELHEYVRPSAIYLVS